MLTRIVCTLGPACATRGVLHAMVDAGMSYARLNFSHGTHDEHRRWAELVRQVAAAAGRTVELIQDLQGPKIRTVDTPRTTLRRGDDVLVSPTARAGALTISEPRALETVEPGHCMYIDDGLIALQALRRAAEGVWFRVLVGGTFEGNQGVAFPSSVYPLPALTERDVADLQVGREIGFEWVALSFVQRAQDLVELRPHLVPGSRAIAKIETAAALDDLPAIVAAADGVMVARGDLGVSIRRARIPLVQKEIIARCRERQVLSTVATEMLRSMVDHPIPSRAEVSDVATAVLDGANAVMLSEETAVGAYPAQAVAEMREIIETVEASPYYRWQPGNDESQGGCAG